MMKPILIVLAATLALSGCLRDESISKFADSSAEYTLVTLDGVAFPARATIAFPEEGVVRGQGPCNSFSARQTVPYPWFAVEGVLSTRRACPDMGAEFRYFAALQDMTQSEVAGDTLILSNPAGRQMVFEAR